MVMVVKKINTVGIYREMQSNIRHAPVSKEIKWSDTGPGLASKRIHRSRIVSQFCDGAK